MGGVGQRLALEAHYLRVLKQTGMLGGGGASGLVHSVGALRRWGQLGAAPAIAARRYGQRPAVIDDLGTISYAELDDRVDRLCNAMRERGLRPGDGVALLARNHRGFLEATFAACKAGARVILLNTDFAGPQIREVAEREGAALLIHDDEYSDVLGDAEFALGRLRAWTDTAGPDTLEALIAEGDPARPPAPDVQARLTILTSGTTGTPKGAPRAQPRSLIPVGALLSRAPFRARETTILCAPMFHSLGFGHGMLGVALGSTLVIRRRFDASVTVTDLVRERPSAMILVPVMLRRVLDDLGETDDTSSLRIVFVSGSRLGAELCTRALERLGPVVHNLYGSTEVAYATIATPQQLAAAPECVGTPPRGAVVRLYDDTGHVIEAAHVTGRIFVGNGLQFSGYTGGGTKETIDGLMSTGDVGHVDDTGRLFVDGRDDEMIVSGGENVFPAEIEGLLAAHDDIVEAAVVGIEDEAFGQRLRAFVVRRDGTDLDVDAVQRHVRERLARYKVPRDVVFVEELPRNPSGKVLKRDLRTRSLT